MSLDPIAAAEWIAENEAEIAYRQRCADELRTCADEHVRELFRIEDEVRAMKIRLAKEATTTLEENQ